MRVLTILTVALFQASLFAQNTNFKCPTLQNYESIRLDRFFGSSYEQQIEDNKKRAVSLLLNVNQGLYARYGITITRPCSGFILDDDPTEIVTNLHCILNTSQIDVYYQNGRSAHVEQVLKIGRQDDLAVLKVKDIGIESLDKLEIAASSDSDNQAVTWPSCQMVNDIFTFFSNYVQTAYDQKMYKNRIEKKYLYNPGFMHSMKIPFGSNEAFLSGNMFSIEGMSGSMVLNDRGQLVGIINGQVGGKLYASLFPSAEAEQNSLARGKGYASINRPVITKASAIDRMINVNSSLPGILNIKDNNYLSLSIAVNAPTGDDLGSYMEAAKLKLQLFNALREKGYDTPELKIKFAEVYIDYVITYAESRNAIPNNELLAAVSEYEAAYKQSPGIAGIRPGLIYSLNLAQQVGLKNQAQTRQRICNLLKEEQALDPSNHTLVDTLRNFSCEN